MVTEHIILASATGLPEESISLQIDSQGAWAAIDAFLFDVGKNDQRNEVILRLEKLAGVTSVEHASAQGAVHVKDMVNPEDAEDEDDAGPTCFYRFWDEGFFGATSGLVAVGGRLYTATNRPQLYSFGVSHDTDATVLMTETGAIVHAADLIIAEGGHDPVLASSLPLVMLSRSEKLKKMIENSGFSVSNP